MNANYLRLEKYNKTKPAASVQKNSIHLVGSVKTDIYNQYALHINDITEAAIIICLPVMTTFLLFFISIMGTK